MKITVNDERSADFLLKAFDHAFARSKASPDLRQEAAEMAIEAATELRKGGACA